MRFSLQLVALLASIFAITAVAPAQIYSVELANEKLEKKFSKIMHELPTGPVILVEIKSGCEIDANGNVVYEKEEDGVLNFYIQNRKDPLELPYRMKADGSRGKAVRKLVLTMEQAKIKEIVPMMSHESWYTLSVLYGRRKQAVADLVRARRRMDKKSEEYAGQTLQILRKLTSLVDWLKSHGYSEAADKLARSAKRERKALGGESEIRLMEAQASAHLVETPNDLSDVTQAVSQAIGKPLQFHVAESKHFKFVFEISRIKDADALEYIKFAEYILEDFRRQFVDPFVGNDFEDIIKDEVIAEFFFGPNNLQVFEQMLTGYYLLDWGPDKETLLQLVGRSVLLPETHLWLDYWRLTPGVRVRDILTHRLGHFLASKHFDLLYATAPIAWLMEGMGYWVSFHHLDSNRTSCVAFRPAAEGHTIATGPEKEEDDSYRQVRYKGGRGKMADTVMKQGRPLHSLFQLSLWDMKSQDVALSWAFLDYLFHTHGEKAQLFLRALATEAVVGPEGYLLRLRKVMNDIFLPAQGEDIFLKLNDEMRAYLTETYLSQ